MARWSRRDWAQLRRTCGSNGSRRSHRRPPGTARGDNRALCLPSHDSWRGNVSGRPPIIPAWRRRVVEEQIGGTCLFLQGATGNIGPKRGFTGDLGVYRKYGKLLGLEASKLALGIETLPRQEKLVGLQESGATIALFEDNAVEPEPAALEVRSRFLQLPLKELPSPEVAEAEAAALRTELNRLRSEGDEAKIREATAKATQAGMRADRALWYHGKTHVDWQLQGIRIGPVALICVPGEPFIEVSQEIAKRSPFPHTLFSGYSNGGFGYIPMREDYPAGGYEVEISPFAPGAAELIVEESLLMLAELHGQKQKAASLMACSQTFRLHCALWSRPRSVSTHRTAMLSRECKERSSPTTRA